MVPNKVHARISIPLVIFYHCLNIINAFAQNNMVFNPSFELIDSCPSTFDQVHFAQGWSAYKQSPDYLNSCASNWIVSTPNNAFGFQNAKTGNAYMGMQIFFTPNTREIIGSHLLSSMIIGQTYFISIYFVATYDTSIQSAGVACLSNKMGVKFSTVPFNTSNPPPINNFAHLYSDSILTDTINWSHLSGTIIADSSYEYVMIGNFFDDMHTDTMQIIHNYSRCYYLVDDICVSNSLNECNLFSYFSEISETNDIIKFNPIDNYIRVINKDHEFAKFFIYDLYSKEIMHGSLKNELNMFDMQETVPGIYIVSIQSEKKRINKRIIIYH